MTIAIHANSGDDVGLGHLVRCTTLARELQGRGVDVTLHVKSDDEAVSFVRQRGVEPTKSDSSRLHETLLESDEEVVVVDSYEFTSEDFERLAEAKTLVVVDELGDRRIPADVVVNNNLYASEISYAEAGEVLAGPDYCMLREPFRDLPEPSYSDPPNSVLLTIGGTDLVNVFAEVLTTTRTVLPEETTLDTVVGPYFEDPTERPAGVTFHRDPDDIHELMWRADMAVSGGGQTLYELAVCGTPTAAITFGDDQVRNIDAFADRGFCLDVGRAGGSGFRESLEEAVGRLLDLNTRRRMGAVGREIVDGEGVRRVADCLVSYTPEHD